jgi:uncharacterized protein (TIGR03435 family)
MGWKGRTGGIGRMDRTGRSLTLAIVALTLATVAAQTPSSPLAFEVASIKRNQSGDDIAEGGFQPGGRINARNVTLVNLIVAAYALPPDRIEGGPSWTNSDRFDVVATGNRKASVAETRQMMQTLLGDRFKLKTRTAPRERPLFELTTRQDRRLGPQLKASAAECAGASGSRESLPPSGPPSLDKPACGTIAFGGGLLRGHGVTLAQMAGSLSNFTGRPVKDRTGLDGLYDFELKWSRPSENPAPGDPPEIFTAIREQLGLQLDATRGPLDVLVIVSADKPILD